MYTLKKNEYPRTKRAFTIVKHNETYSSTAAPFVSECSRVGM